MRATSVLPYPHNVTDTLVMVVHLCSTQRVQAVFLSVLHFDIPRLQHDVSRKIDTGVVIGRIVWANHPPTRESVIWNPGLIARNRVAAVGAHHSSSSISSKSLSHGRRGAL